MIYVTNVRSKIRRALKLLEKAQNQSLNGWTSDHLQNAMREINQADQIEMYEQQSKTPELVIVESPYAGDRVGDVERNTIYAQRAVRDAFERGEVPFASHLLYTQPNIFDDKNPEERLRGIEAGYAWWPVVQCIAFYSDYGWSRGMYNAYNRAQILKFVTEEREIGKNP